MASGRRSAVAVTTAVLLVTDGSDDAERFVAAVLRRTGQLAVELLDEPWADPH